MTASRYGKVEMIKLLLELGADVKIRHKSGKHAKEFACFELADKSNVKEIESLILVRNCFFFFLLL
jgi:ankyrin repeat protein